MAVGDLTATLGNFRFRKCAVFDGSNDVATRSTGLALGSNDFSVSIWLNTESTALSFVIGQDHNGAQFWALKINATANKITFQIRDAGNNLIQKASTTSVNDGNWHHVAAVRNGSTITIYIDGTDEGSATNAATGIVSTTDFAFDIGGRSFTSSLFFKGAVHRVAIWKRALTQSEITTLAANNEISSTKAHSWALESDYNDSAGSLNLTNNGSYLTHEAGTKNLVKANADTLTVSMGMHKAGCLVLPVQGRDAQFHVIGVTRTAV